jgi:hypothetical protein
MELLLLIPGLIMLVVVAGDFLVTVFVPKGAGMMTQAITMSVVKIFRLLSGNRGASRILNYKGVTIIISMVMGWLVITWIAVTFIYSSDPNSILHGENKQQANFLEKFYFVGYTLSTLGPGDFEPNGWFWQLATAFLSLTGFSIITISISYIIPVINNIIEKHILSLHIASLGESTHEILVNGFDGNDFNNLADEFSELSKSIFKFAKNHSAYPILHHVHSSDKDENTVLKLATLDEALNILIFHIPPEQSMQRIKLNQTRKSITYYLKAIRNVSPSKTPPPVPDFDALNQALGIELINTKPDEVASLYKKLNKRRCLLKGLVEDDGFTWDSLEGDKFRTDLDVEIKNH